MIFDIIFTCGDYMKKIFKFLMVFCLFVTACKKEECETIDYIEYYDLDWQDAEYNSFKYTAQSKHMEVEHEWKEKLFYIESIFEYNHGGSNEKKEYEYDKENKEHRESYSRNYGNPSNYSLSGKIEDDLYITKSDIYKIEYYQIEYFDKILKEKVLNEILKEINEYSFSPNLLQTVIVDTYYNDYSTYGVEYKIANSDTYEPTYSMKSTQPFSISVPSYDYYNSQKLLCFENIDILVIKGIVVKWNVIMRVDDRDIMVKISNKIKILK